MGCNIFLEVRPRKNLLADEEVGKPRLKVNDYQACSKWLETSTPTESVFSGSVPRRKKHSWPVSDAASEHCTQHSSGFPAGLLAQAASLLIFGRTFLFWVWGVVTVVSGPIWTEFVIFWGDSFVFSNWLF